jgi:cell division septation protein DedD
MTLLVASSVLAQSTYDQGTAAYRHGDFEAAVAVFRPMAENGDAKAQAILGMMYSYGEGVPMDHRESVRWYRRAAEQNYSVAQYHLGMAYLEGKGTKANTDEAIAWLAKAADRGHFRARNQLTNLDAGYYSNSQSPPSDSLAAPPTLMPTETEPRSVVMRKRVPPAPERAPRTSRSMPALTTAGVAATSPPAKTSQVSTPAHVAVDNNNTRNDVKPAQSSANSDRVYRVQLSASRSEENIRRAWSSYQQRYSDIFGGLDGSVERAEIGEEKTVWYRLRVGPFASKASAKELCSKLAARNIKTGCLPLRASR